jgi:hypothetical protein
MNSLIAQIKKQTTILFDNIEVTMNALDTHQLEKVGSWEWPIGEQFFHLLHSLDQWFVNPYDYKEPSWGQSTSGSSNKISTNYYSKNELHFYFSSIREKINYYLEELDELLLSEKPKNCNFTRFELVLGQYRHVMYHIGLIHGCIRADTGASPEYIGLGPPIPAEL